MRVLICVDNDLRYEDVLSAMDWCLGLGEDDELFVAHVVASLRWMPTSTDDDPGWSGAERGILDKAQEFVDQTAARFDNVTSRALLLEGDAAAEVTATSIEHDVDVIVLGALGQARSQDFLIGSVAEKIATASHRSVLLVRDAPQASDGGYRALLAVDGSKAALDAVDVFARRPSARRARIQLLHVLEVPPVTWDLDVRGSGDLSDSVPPALRERADRAIDSAREILDKHGLTAESELRRGAAASEILEGARVFRADLMVMGSRGLGSPGPLTGSVGRRVARHVPCSVFMVYPKTQAG